MFFTNGGFREGVWRDDRLEGQAQYHRPDGTVEVEIFNSESRSRSKVALASPPPSPFVVVRLGGGNVLVPTATVAARGRKWTTTWRGSVADDDEGALDRIGTHSRE